MRRTIMSMKKSTNDENAAYKGEEMPEFSINVQALDLQALPSIRKSEVSQNTNASNNVTN